MWLQISTGAQNDLQKITKMAYSTVAVYGMNDKVGLVSFPQDNNRFDKPYSDETAQTIDREARDIIFKCYDRTLDLLREKKALVEALAQV
jgi:AFG3 family protein